MRPIIAGPTSQTHSLSNLIDILLSSLTNQIKSYLHNSTDFLNKLPKDIPPETLLVSFDLVLLCSNTHHDLGLEAIEYWLRKCAESLPSRVTKDFVLEGIKHILENNTFYFNGKYYSQKKGTARGTKFAPVYATLVVSYLEEKLYNEIKSSFEHDFSSFFIDNWKRFLDDCFIP